MEISALLGLGMLLAGAVNLSVCKTSGAAIRGRQWIAAEGATSMLLSIFPLLNRMVQASLLPFFFGMWELFSGILKLCESKELKEENIRGWRWLCGIGAVELASGIASLLRPVNEFVGMHIVVAIVLLVQCAGFVVRAALFPRLCREEERLSPDTY